MEAGLVRHRTSLPSQKYSQNRVIKVFPHVAAPRSGILALLLLVLLDSSPASAARQGPRLERALLDSSRVPFLPSQLDFQDQDQAQTQAQAPSQASSAPQLNPPTEVFPVCKEQGNALVVLSSGNVSSVTWKGWGTSLAWFANYVGGLPAPQLDHILDLIFSQDKGLGLNIVRFNIPGGYNASLSPQFTNIFKFRAVPGYRDQEQGPYNWGADEAQRTVLLGAKARGADTFTAASYSPPWWATVSGDVAGNKNRSECNLKPEYFAAFADYLTEVVRHYRDEVGVLFETLEPTNEPDDGGWNAGNTQEGCSFGVPDMDRLFPLVSTSLESKGLQDTRVAITNGWALTDARNLAKFSEGLISSMQRVHVHGYINLQSREPWRAPEFHYGAVRDEAEKARKEVWQTEWTFLRQSGADLDLGMVMARCIMESVNYMGASAWVFFQAVDTTPRFSLINLHWDVNQRDSGTAKVTKKWWVLKQFAMFAKPGSRALKLESSTGCEHCTAAFFDAGRKRLAFFVVNQQAASRQVSILLSQFTVARGATDMTVKAYRTSAMEDIAEVQLADGIAAGTAYPADAHGRSLTTIVIDNIEVQ